MTIRGLIFKDHLQPGGDGDLGPARITPGGHRKVRLSTLEEREHPAHAGVRKTDCVRRHRHVEKPASPPAEGPSPATNSDVTRGPPPMSYLAKRPSTMSPLVCPSRSSNLRGPTPTFADARFCWVRSRGRHTRSLRFGHLTPSHLHRPFSSCRPFPVPCTEVKTATRGRPSSRSPVLDLLCRSF